MDTIDGATIDPNPDSGAQFLQELLAKSATQTNQIYSNNAATQSSLHSDALSWVPLVMRSRDFKPGFRLSKRFSTRCPKGEAIGGYKVLNRNGEKMVNSLGGILSTALGTWNKNRGRFPSRKNPNPSTNAEYEKLEEYDYPAVGCDCQLVMSRANGGLVFYEKVDKDGDIMVHNVIAHNARPTDKDADDLSLSVAQKIKALEKYGKVCRLCKLLHIVFVSLYVNLIIL